MLKIGVLGAGHFGKIHIKLLLQIEAFELVGFYDIDPVVREKVTQEYGVKSFDSADQLIDQVDVVDIVTPTLTHFDCAERAIKKSKHLFIEKPVTNSVAEAKKLIDLANEANVKIQIGHNERYNPAFTAISPFIKQPMFIEIHRLSKFNVRGTDVSVVIDLMIHDIDIVLSIVKSNVRKISANGVAVVSDSPDITNARIEFDNGCVANLTASRLSLKNMRKSRIFQKDTYLSVDFLNKEAAIMRIENKTEKTKPTAFTIDPQNGNSVKEINFERPEILNTNAIKKELTEFAKVIEHNQQPLVSLVDGYNALDVAQQIIDKLEINQ